MSADEEPLYCIVCGQEWGIGESCGHDPVSTGGTDPDPPFETQYCHVDGVIPAPGKACHFHVQGGRPQPCEGEPA